MNKYELIIAAKLGYPDPEKMVDNVLLALNTAFMNKEIVNITDFGTFKPYKRGMPQFKDGMHTVIFKPCLAMRKMLNR